MSLALFAPLVDCHYHCCCCFYCWRLAVNWSCLLTVRRIQRINGRLLAVCHLANNGSADQQWQPAEWQRRFSKNYTHPACTTARTKSSRGPVWPRFEHFRHSSADLEKSFHMYARKLCNKPVRGRPSVVVMSSSPALWCLSSSEAWPTTQRASSVLC